MKKTLTAIAMLFALPASAFAQGVTGPAMSESAMMEMVEAWFTGADSMSKKGKAGIPEIMALTHEDIAYIHTEYDANYDRAALIDGFERSIKRADTRNESHVVTNMLDGKNMMAVQRNIKWDEKVEDGWKTFEKEKLTTLFEFRDGRIWRITEYWE